MYLPEFHRDFMERILPQIKNDHRFLGLAVGSSSTHVDDYSDLNLMVVVDDYHHDDILYEMEEIVSHLGTLLGCFTSERVGERDRITCLYDHPMLRVVFRFCRLETFKNERQSDPRVMWERGHRLSRAISGRPAVSGAPNPQTIENRFWIRVQALAARLIRGEYCEVLNGIAAIRAQVLAPLARFNEDLAPVGVRNLEEDLPHQMGAFQETVPGSLDREALTQALMGCVDFYRELRDEIPARVLNRNRKAEKAVVAWMEQALNQVEVYS